MAKKNNPLDDKSSKQLPEILKGLFGGSDPLTMLMREHKPIPLKKKGDIEYEVRWHTTD
ncbi:hypothetical protein [Cohnella boryungensis]|uniref:hypothetical protein n=1 Tax=Cohnella boryungensis TaxID=768479 RepID=UPI00195860EF